MVDTNSVEVVGDNLVNEQNYCHLGCDHENILHTILFLDDFQIDPPSHCNHLRRMISKSLHKISIEIQNKPKTSRKRLKQRFNFR